MQPYKSKPQKFDPYEKLKQYSTVLTLTQQLTYLITGIDSIPCVTGQPS